MLRDLNMISMANVVNAKQIKAVITAIMTMLSEIQRKYMSCLKYIYNICNKSCNEKWTKFGCRIACFDNWLELSMHSISKIVKCIKHFL